MNSRTIFVFLMLAVSGSAAHAQCMGSPLTAAQLSGYFGGKTLSFNCISGCAAWMGSTAVDWHEIHNGLNGGSLVEVGTGTSGLQPQDTVGTWYIDEGDTTDDTDDEICYAYTGDGTYCHQVYDIGGGNYAFCLAGLHKATGTVD